MAPGISLLNFEPHLFGTLGDQRLMCPEDFLRKQEDRAAAESKLREECKQYRPGRPGTTRVL